VNYGNGTDDDDDDDDVTIMISKKKQEEAQKVKQKKQNKKAKDKIAANIGDGYIITISRSINASSRNNYVCT